jgi:anti-anti-sigma factor
MELHFSEMENSISLIKLTGSMDTQGVGTIETKFAGYSTGDNARVLVDLSGVEFLASIGIRLLVTTAKSVVRRGGKFVIANPNENVYNVLEMAGIKEIIPIYTDFEQAISELKS